MRINPFFYGVLVVLVFLGTVQGFKAAGIWSVSGKISSDGQAAQPIASDVNSIKGWMTLEQISTVFGVPVSVILAEFDLPAETAPTTAIKDLETDTFSVTNLRDWLQNRAETSPSKSTTPAPAEKPAPMETPTPELMVQEPSPTAAALEHATELKTVSGKTTIQDLLDWGVPQEMIEQILGDELPSPTTVIKDYVAGKGLEFSPIKALLQAEVDKVK